MTKNGIAALLLDHLSFGQAFMQANQQKVNKKQVLSSQLAVCFFAVFLKSFVLFQKFLLDFDEKWEKL